MNKIALTQGKTALVDDQDFHNLNRFKWCAAKLTGSKTFYATRHGPKTAGKHQTIFMHREIMQAPPGSMIDHINGDGLCNLRKNLRFCSPSESSCNRSKRIGALSCYKGVALSYTMKTRPWRSRIRLNGKLNHLGYFRTELEAARAYDYAALLLFGEFARTNFVY